jgi:MFS family permease
MDPVKPASGERLSCGLVVGLAAWIILGSLVSGAVWLEWPFRFAPVLTPASGTGDAMVGGLTWLLILFFTGGFVGGMLWAVSWAVVAALLRRSHRTSQDRMAK